MSDNKKYYYLKLKESFFDSEEIKLIEAQENGYIYSTLYLKMTVLSLKDDGRLMFKGRIPYDEKMLSTITGIPIDNVRCGIKILSDFGLVEILESGVIYMTDIQLLIGHGSTEGERKAKYRKRIDTEKKQLGQSPGQNPPELEIEIKKELEIEKPFISISQIDHIPDKPEDPKICEYLQYYYLTYNNYYGILARPKQKDYETIEELKDAVSNNIDRYKLIVHAFFENEYFFNRDNNKKPSHYLKSLLTNIGTVASDIKKPEAQIVSKTDEGFKAFMKNRRGKNND